MLGAGRILAATVIVAAAGLAAACDDPAAPPDVAPTTRCDGVALDDVRGIDAAPPPRRLLEHAASDAVCEAWWIPALADGFVPQGLVVREGQATIVGHDGLAPVGGKDCRVLVLDLATGDVVRRVDRLAPPPGAAVTGSCRHGGGLAASAEGLWVAETTRLWLLDPATLTVQRAWRLDEGVRGSTLVATRGRIGIAGFRVGGPGRISWYDERAMLGDAVVRLRGRRGVGDVGPVAVGRVPALLQGITAADDGIWEVSSRTACGRLALPSGDVVGFVPGAEGLQVGRRDVWLVSEASAAPYRSEDEPLVPALLRLDRAQVEDGAPPACEI